MLFNAAFTLHPGNVLLSVTFADALVSFTGRVMVRREAVRQNRLHQQVSLNSVAGWSSVVPVLVIALPTQQVVFCRLQLLHAEENS